MRNILKVRTILNYWQSLPLFLMLSATTLAETQQEIYQKMIDIVVSQSQTIAAVGVVVDIQERKKVWESEARLLGRYTDNQTLDTPGGLSYKGELAFKYPLFADEKNANVAEAKAKSLVEKERVVGDFTAKLEEVGKMCLDWQVTRDILDLALQDFERTKAGVESQVLASDKLGTALADARARSGDEYKARGALRGRITTLSLQYGGTLHSELKSLIIQYENMGYGSCNVETASPVPSVNSPPQ